MKYKLRYTKLAAKQFADLRRTDVGKHRKVVNCFRKLEENPKHPGLNSHRYSSMLGPNGEEIWESYVENNTPAAWRVFWCYGSDEKQTDPSTDVINVITVVAMASHP